MVARRYWLSLLTIVALVVPALVVVPQAVRAQELQYVVDTLNDDEPPPSGAYCVLATVGDCSLRRALTIADSDSVASKIVFSSTLNGVINVNPIKALPPLTTGTTIDGLANSAPPTIRIEINGGGASFAAFRITGGGNRIQGLSIYGFNGFGVSPGGAGIWIDGQNASSNTILFNYIGLNRTLGLATGNFNGILISGGANNNTIEGGNFISNNANNGILIAGSRKNTIQGNIVGLRSQGGTVFAAGNGQFGIQITTDSVLGTGDSAENTIGGSSPNIISANGESGSLIRAGIVLRTSGTISTTISGNFIGTGFSGAGAFGNNGDGIRIQEGASNNEIIGSPAQLTVTSANSAYGIRITGAGTDGNEVQGVYVGTNEDATGPRANGLGGVRIDDGASGNTILAVDGEPTVIAGNNGPGVMISGATTSGNSIQGALLGVAPDPDVSNGSLSIPNAAGVLVEGGAANTLISGNTVSANTLYGIRLSGALSTTVQSNLVGLSSAGTGVIANGGPGIAVAESRNTLVGGATTALGNTVAGNAGPGVVITGTTTLSTTVAGNQIGLRLNAITGLFTDAAGNTGEGVLVADGPRLTVVGGLAGNIIADTAASAGVRVAGSSTTTTTVSLNQIGWVANGDNPPFELPAGDGIAVQSAGTVVITGNSVRFSTGSAVHLTGATDTTVVGNTLSESDGDGVLVDGAALNVDVQDNTLRNNAGDAVRVTSGSRAVAIQNNRMAANGGAISLEGTAPYDGTPPDTGTPGANHDIDPPFGLRVSQSGLITGFVYTSTIKTDLGRSPASACITCTIEVFQPDPLAPPDGQGWERLRVTQAGVTDDRITQFADDGSGRFEAQLVGPLPKQLLLAATDYFGNTSEFAVFNPSAGLILTPLNYNPAIQDAVPGQTVTYTLQLENNGTLDLNNLEFQSGGTLADWVVQRIPATSPIALPSGGSREITVTLTLPTGSNPSVQVPKVDTTTITVTSPGLVTETEQLVTTVLARPVLKVLPSSSSGRGKPNDLVTYQHRIYNDGNIPVTVQLQARTIDAADSGQIWATTLNNSTEPIAVTIGSGLFATIVVSVRVPSTAQETDSEGNPVSVTTLITGTVDGYPELTLPFSDTTRVSLQTAAEMFQDEEQDGGAAGQVVFFHTVTNTSNGRATFKLNYLANLGSTVQFSSDTEGVTISQSNTFTLDNVFQPPAKRNTMTLRVTVTLNRRLLPGETEVINISLTDPANGESIGGASVVDRVNIRTGLVLPRLWLPLMAAN